MNDERREYIAAHRRLESEAYIVGVERFEWFFGDALIFRDAASIYAHVHRHYPSEWPIPKYIASNPLRLAGFLWAIRNERRFLPDPIETAKRESKERQVMGIMRDNGKIPTIFIKNVSVAETVRLRREDDTLPPYSATELAAFAATNRAMDRLENAIQRAREKRRLYKQEGEPKKADYLKALDAVEEAEVAAMTAGGRIPEIHAKHFAREIWKNRREF